MVLPEVYMWWWWLLQTASGGVKLVKGSGRRLRPKSKMDIT